MLSDQSLKFCPLQHPCSHTIMIQAHRCLARDYDITGSPGHVTAFPKSPASFPMLIFCYTIHSTAFLCLRDTTTPSLLASPNPHAGCLWLPRASPGLQPHPPAQYLHTICAFSCSTTCASWFYDGNGDCLGYCH